MALMYEPERFTLLQVAYVGTQENAVASIEKAWSFVNPDLKIDYNEIESEVTRLYEIFFGDIVKVLGFVSLLAILISCLGLLGMATYSTETRIKEISIRKILGSSSSALVLLLSKGFLTILGLAIALGVPAAYFINKIWLDMIAYHTSLNLGDITIGVFILILFGVLTIGSQTIRATFVKPVENLKSE
jgi:putative ABC transport system permease protein